MIFFHWQMQALKVDGSNFKIRNQYKIINVIHFAYVQWYFKTLKQLLDASICVSDSFTNFDAYFKALVNFLKLQLGKVLFSQHLIH